MKTEEFSFYIKKSKYNKKRKKKNFLNGFLIFSKFLLIHFIYKTIKAQNKYYIKFCGKDEFKQAKC